MARLGRARARQRNKQTAVDLAVAPSSIVINQSGSTLIGDIQTFTATLAGGGLRDTWTWSVVAAPTGDTTFTFIPANPQQLRWRPRVAGTYTLRLTISNAAGSSFTDISVTCSAGTGSGPRWVFIVGSDTTWTTAELILRDHMIERGHRITAMQASSASAYTSVNLGFDAVLMSNDANDASVGTKYASTKPFMTLSPYHAFQRSFASSSTVYTGESVSTWTINGAAPNGDYSAAATPTIFFANTINDVISTVDLVAGTQVTAQDAPEFNESVAAFRVDVGSAGATNRYALFSIRGATISELNRAGWDLFDDHLAWILGSAASVDALGNLEGPVNRPFTRIAREYGLSSVTARSWKIQSGPGTGTSLGTSATLTWTPSVIGTYTLRYSATANGGTVYTDDVTLTVSAFVQTGYRYWKWQPTSIRDTVTANSMQIAEFALFDSWSETRLTGIVANTTTPTVANQVTGSNNTATTTHTVTKPTGSGGQLVVFFTYDTATTTASTSSTNWQLVHTEAQGATTNHSMTCLYHPDADAAPNLVVTLSVAQCATWVAYRVTNAGTPMSLAWNNGGSATSATLPSHTGLPAATYLALCAVGTDASTTTAQSVTFPAGFSNAQSINPTVTASAATFSAQQVYTPNVTSITPGSVTIGSTEQWIVYTAVFPGTAVSPLVTNGVAYTAVGSSSNVGETGDYAGDGDVNTKWLNFNKTTGYLDLDFGQAVSPDSYRIATANDASERDPTGWDLYGSTDNATWVLVARETAFSTSTQRQTWTSRRSLNQIPTFDSLTDSFAATNGTLWGYGASTAYTGGALVINNNSGFTSYAATQIPYTLINSSIVIEVTAGPTEGQLYIQTGASTSNIGDSGLMWQITGGTLSAQRNVASVRTQVGSGITYNATSHRFLRIRESGGTVYWDYSADGINWTNYTSWVSTISLTAQYLVLGAGGGAGASSVSYGGVNYINAIPVPPTVPNSVTSAYLRTTTAGTDIFRYEIQDSVVSGAAGQMFLYLPGTKTPGATTKVAIIGHGYTDPAGTFWENYASGAVPTLADKMADAGYACIVPEQSTTFGNSDAQARITRAYTYMATNWVVGANACYVGFSMGGGSFAVALHKKTISQIKTAALFSPAVGWTRFTGSEFGVAALWAAYGASDKPTFLVNSASWEPNLQPASSYNTSRVRASSSSGDNTISRTLDVLPFLTIIGNGQGTQAVDYSATGDHSEAGLWASPDTVVSFLDFGISNPNSAPSSASMGVAANNATVTTASVTTANAGAAAITVAGQTASGGARSPAAQAASFTAAGQTAAANVQARPTAATLTVAGQTVTSAGPPKLDTLTDTFDTSINTTKWNINGTSPTVTGGRLAITPSTAYDSISSKTSYTLTSTAGYVEVPTTVNVGNGSTGQFFNLAAYNNVDNSIEIVSTGNTLFAFKWVAGAQTTLGSVTYSATNHRWWRIRESAGTTYFEAGPSSSNFATQIATASTATLTTGGMTFAQVVVNMGSGYGGTEPSPGSPTFDNLNTAGAAATNAPGGNATLTVSGQTAATSVQVFAGAAAITATGQTATITGVTRAPATAATLTVSGQSATTTSSGNALPTAASLSVTGQSATTLGVTSAPATAATYTATAQQASVTSIAVANAPATAATLTVAGQNTTSSVLVNAGLASLTAAGQSATTTSSGNATPTAATLTVASQGAGVTTSSSASVSAGAAALTVSGQNATVSISESRSGTPTAASLTVAGQTTTSTVQVNAGLASLAVAGQAPATAVRASATAASLAVAAQNATITISESRSPTAGAGSFTATAQSAVGTISATATSAALTVVGQLATKTVNPSTTAAPVTVAGQNASGFISESRSPAAGLASLAVTGQTTTTTNASRPPATAATLAVASQNASVSASPTSTTATAILTGYNASVTISESRTNTPDTAPVVVTAGQASIFKIESRSPVAGAASIGVAANNASGSSAAFKQALAQTATFTTMQGGYGLSPYGASPYGLTGGAGADANISIAAKPPAAAFTDAGQNATATPQTRANATAATIAVTGQSATATVVSRAPATAATLTTTGQNAAISIPRSTAAAPVTMAGQNATVSISESRSPVATAAAVSIAAQSATVTGSGSSTAQAAAVSIAAQNATTTSSGSTTAQAAATTFAGQNATIVISESRTIPAGSASITVGAYPASASTASRTFVNVETASLAATGQGAQAAVAVVATTGTIAVSGQSTTSTVSTTSQVAAVALAGQSAKVSETSTAQAGTLALAGQNASVTISESRNQLATTAPVTVAGQAARDTIAPTPTAAALTVAALDASIVISESRSATPTTATLAVAGQAATAFVLQSGSANPLPATVAMAAQNAGGSALVPASAATLTATGQNAPAQVSAFASAASITVVGQTTTSTVKPTAQTSALTVAAQSITVDQVSNVSVNAQAALVAVSGNGSTGTVATIATLASVAAAAQNAAQAISGRAQTASAAISGQGAAASVAAFAGAAAVGVTAAATTSTVTSTPTSASILVQAYQISSQGAVGATATTASVAVAAQNSDGRVSTGPSTATLAAAAQNAGSTTAIPALATTAPATIAAQGTSSSVRVSAGVATAGVTAASTTNAITSVASTATLAITAGSVTAQTQSGITAQTAALAVAAASTTSKITPTIQVAPVGVEAIDATIASASYVNPLAGAIDLAVDGQQAHGSLTVNAGTASVGVSAVDASTTTAAYANPAPSTASVAVTAGAPATSVRATTTTAAVAVAAQPVSTSVQVNAGVATVSVAAQTTSATVQTAASGAAIAISARDVLADAITRVYALQSTVSVSSGDAATTIQTTSSTANVGVQALIPGSNSAQAVYAGAAVIAVEIIDTQGNVRARASAGSLSATSQEVGGTATTNGSTAQFAAQGLNGHAQAGIVGAARVAHIAIGADSPDLAVLASARAALLAMIAGTPEALVPALIGKITMMLRKVADMRPVQPSSMTTNVLIQGRGTATISATMKKDQVNMVDATGIRRGTRA